MAKRRSRARAKKHGRRKFRARTGFGATKPVAVAALAQQPVRVVNIIPESLSGESNQDSEPSLAVNPANPLQMAASAFTPALSGNAPIFVSVDGGNTWLLNAIVPSDRMTADITVSFVGKSTTLYAGIIPQPIIDNTPGLNILRTDNFLGPTKMKILVDRTAVYCRDDYRYGADQQGSGRSRGKRLQRSRRANGCVRPVQQCRRGESQFQDNSR